ncbi:MAG: class I SAM-dependent methyltransferase [Chloroflexota bacterium]|nr:class I SAM-dependent methyltransferase [Chloroflexota bacterium]
MSRWSRAARALDLPDRSRVLDLGCAFGFGTRRLLPRYRAYGHDLSAEYIARARRTVRGAVFTHGSAEQVPYPDNSFDGVLLLDVLEHVPDEQAVVREVRRILRPGGRLIVSVPNRGLLGGLDSLNLYQRWFGPTAPAPTDDPSWSASPRHRHYSLADLIHLLGGDFRRQGVEYTGLGFAESVNLLLLLFFRRLLPAPRLYAALQYLYFGVYLLEDLLRTGSWGYHMMVTLERQ